MQIDPLDPSGQLIFTTDDFMSSLTNGSDRLSLDGSDFTKEKFPTELTEVSAPCGAVAGRELQSQTGYGWIFQCSSPANHQSPVQFNKDQAVVLSDSYRYYFDSDNHILFKKVEIKNNNDWLAVAEGSSVNIRSDIKKFFTLNFEPSDITSRLEEYRFGPMGMVGRVRFYLNILFFKIKLSLVTDVSFFKNAAHVPMIMYSPVDASKYLNPMSGIYYFWKSPLDMKKIAIPESLIKSEGIRDWLGKNCPEKLCYHSLVAPNLFKMEFQIPKSLEERSFLPIWAVAHKENKAIIPAIPKKAEGNGLYFETSGLLDGGHQWNFWLGLGDAKESQCPSSVIFERGYLK